MPDEGRVRIKFGGETHSVNGTTFLNSLSSFITITEEVNKEVNSHEKISVEINALEAGSFDVYLDLVTSVYEASKPIFHGVNSIDDILTIITGVYSFRYFLEGKQPKHEESTENGISVTNHNGEVKNFRANVYNIYTENLSVTEALNNNFDALNSDESVTDFSIIDEEDELRFSVDRNEFPKLTDQDFKEIQENEKSVRTRNSIIVFKVVFGKNYTWQFIHKGNKINAKVKDDNFMKKIEAGDYRFGKGDILEVELEILKVFDPSLKTYINKKYQVNKVFDHIPRDSQGKLNFERSN